MRSLSELRQDIVTGDWIVVATGRARRPQDFAAGEGVPRVPKSECPFERLLPAALAVFDRGGESYRLTAKDRSYLMDNWWLQVVPNKYPAFGRGSCRVLRRVGPHHAQDGVGFHEVLVTRDHDRSPGLQRPAELAVLLKAYRERYLALKDELCVEYISIFHNHGQAAGASIYHPHSQLVAIPVVPPDVGRSLRGSRAYFHQRRRCVHCTMVAFERRERRRIVFENRDFIAFCPYVSRTAFEVRMFPKRHNPQFETMSDGEVLAAAEVLFWILSSLHRKLNDPAYNFFIHTAPPVQGDYRHYHWHVEVLPKTAIWAGFEIGTGIEISTIAPETAAKFLRR